MAEMAEALGYVEQASSYLDRSVAIQEAINEILFLPDQGCYAASRLDGEMVVPAPHAQAWALRYDVVPAEHRASTVQALIRQLSPFFNETGWSVVEPLGMSATLDALATTGRTSAALSLIRERYGDLIAQGATTWWEVYTPNQDRGQSLSHSWGGSPTWFLSSHVLGGTVSGPNRWRVAPHPGDLKSAQGAVPLGTGLLSIDWQRPRCGQFHLNVAAPQGTAGDILLPTTRQDAHVLLNGETIWDNGPAGEQPIEMTSKGLFLSEVVGGEHVLSFSHTCYSTFFPYLARR
jgi:alpha-L-rhamnosidase